MLSVSLPPQLNLLAAPFVAWAASEDPSERLPIEALIAIALLLSLCLIWCLCCCYCRLRSYMRYRTYRVVDHGITNVFTDDVELD